jgi:hypothetical protein
VSDRISADELTAALAKRGVLRADAQVPETSRSDRPWFIGVLLGTAGWMAGVFGLAFVALLFKPSSTVELATAGVILLAAAFVLYASDRESAFFDQLALALSIAGQLALAWEFIRGTGSIAGTALLVALMECGLVVVLPNHTARLLATLFACIACALAIRVSLWGGDMIFGFDQRVASLGPALAGWCMIWIPTMAAAWLLIGNEVKWMSTGMRRILRPLLSGLLLSVAFGTLASEPTGVLQFWMPITAAQNWLVLWPLLAALAALFAAFCAFRMRDNALLGASIAAALLHVLQFYYLLGTTLLMKSAIMLVIGALLLTGSAMIRRRTIAP